MRVQDRDTAIYAALDLGTSNCRLLVAMPDGDGFRVMDSFSRIVRLGEGLQATGRLSEAAMQRTMDALHDCAAKLAYRRPAQIMAVATEACRRASNAADFLDRVRRETGLAIRVISAREEAELVMRSCATLIQPAARRVLLFDIGGGSTELAWAQPVGGDVMPRLAGTISLPFGVISLHDAWKDSACTRDGFSAMVDDMAAHLAAFEAVHCIRREIRNTAMQMIGASGTMTMLAGLALQLPRYRRDQVDGQVIARDALYDAIAQAREMGLAGLAEHPCIGPHRADLVLSGCAIFAAICRIWPVGHVTIADRGLRDGMLLRQMRNATTSIGATRSDAEWQSA